MHICRRQSLIICKLGSSEHVRTQNKESCVSYSVFYEETNLDRKVVVLSN